jgi:hypothetical protein
MTAVQDDVFSLRASSMRLPRSDRDAVMVCSAFRDRMATTPIVPRLERDACIARCN